MKRAAVVLALLLAVQPLHAELRPWRQAITDPDRKRLAGLWKTWELARTQVAAAGHSAEWSALGDLVEPLASAPGGPPPPGQYRCRTVKLGTRTPGMPVWAMSDVTPCRFDIDGDYLRFADGGGVQRTAGLLYPDGERMIYLGALTLGAEPGRFKYRRDGERDQVGVLHRIGPARWRLELPLPKWESTMDVIDIVPSE